MYPNEEYMKTAFHGVSHRLDGIEEKAVQGDWNQNDPTAPDYIKNRTHWVETEMAEVIPETTAVPVEFEVNGETFYVTTETAIAINGIIQPGDHYVFTFNGVTYKGEWIAAPDTEDNLVYFGNFYLTVPGRIDFGAEDTGEPFGAYFDRTGEKEMTGGIFTRSTEEVTCSLAKEQEVVRQLDPKFIKDMYYAEKSPPVGSGFSAWEAVARAPDYVIPKVTVAGTEYLAVKPFYGQGFSLAYNLGGTTLTVRRNSDNSAWRNELLVNGNVSLDDIAFYRSTDVYHQIPIQFVPDELWDTLSSLSVEVRGKMSSDSPAGSGAFSMNRRSKTAVGTYSATFGSTNAATGVSSCAQGFSTEAAGRCSHAEGYGTIAIGRYSHVQGKFNVQDIDDKYAHIVGNGTSAAIKDRSNAHTLDWTGNAWFAGTVEGTGLILKSSTEGSNKRFFVSVDDTGTLSAKEITET